MPDKKVICHINLARGFRGGERQTELLAHGLSRLGWEQVLIAGDTGATRKNDPDSSRLTARN